MEAIEKLQEALDGVPDDYIVFIETSAEDSFEVSTLLVKYFSSKNDRGIILSANRPYVNLISVYEKNDIDVSKMFILDCLSKSQHADSPADNVTFIENLSALTDISLSIEEHINGTPGKKFIFVYNGNLYLADVEGTPPKQLTSNNQNSRPRWAAARVQIDAAPGLESTPAITSTAPVTASDVLSATESLQ